MRKRVSFRLFLSVIIVAVVFSFPLWGRRPARSGLKVFEFKELGSCLLYSDQWEIRCPLDQFISILHKNKEKHLGKRYVLAKALYQALIKLRESRLGKKETQVPQYFTPKVEMDEDTFIRYLYPSNFFPQRKYLVNKEAEFVEQVKAYIHEIQQLLDPLINNRSESKEAFLKNEAIELYFNALGDSLHFEALNQFIGVHKKTLLSSKKRRERVFRALDRWSELYGAYPIKGWFLKNLIEHRPETIKGERESEFFYWVKSLKLIPRPIAPNQKKTALEKIRKLWIAFPAPEKNLQLKKLLNYLGLSKEYQSPSIAEMLPEEAFTRIRSFIRALDGKSALRAVERLYDRAKLGKLNKAEIWKAFTLHVRILRLIDRREKIPKIIQNYEKLAKFQTGSKKPGVVALERMYKIATYYWTYEDPQNALALLKKIENLDKKNVLQGKILYVRARIFEQSEKPQAAYVHIAKALEYKKLRLDQKNDLMWRALFLKLEQATSKKDYQVLQKEVEAIKEVASQSKNFDRWQFWKARISFLAGQQTESVKLYKELFAREPLTYYGVLAGSALEEMKMAPKEWVLSVDQKTTEPVWGNYMDSRGLAKKDVFIPFAKVYNLVRAGELSLAEESYYALDAKRRQVLNSMRRSKSSKFFFARDVAWLRKKLGDPRGALQAAEGLRIRFHKSLSARDMSYLYPMAFWDLVEKSAHLKGVDPWVVVSVIRQESVFNPKARSFANALGLMQLIPSTARKEAALLSLKNFRLESLYEPEQSIKLGVNHLAGHFNAFDQSFICAFAAYNAGRPPVKKWLEYYNPDYPLLFIERISYKETRNYVKKLIRNYINYKRIYEKAEFDKKSLFKMPQKLSSEVMGVNRENTSDRVKAQ